MRDDAAQMRLARLERVLAGLIYYIVTIPYLDATDIWLSDATPAVATARAELTSAVSSNRLRI